MYGTGLKREREKGILLNGMKEEKPECTNLKKGDIAMDEVSEHEKKQKKLGYMYGKAHRRWF